jgi:hypothetical protein
MHPGGNWEFQYYCEDPNVLKVQDGTLIIQVTSTFLANNQTIQSITSTIS